MTTCATANPLTMWHLPWPDRSVSAVLGDWEASLYPDPSQLYGERVWQVWKAYDDASTPDWNGEQAEAISPATMIQAGRFLRTLPLSLPEPEVSPDPEGRLLFEWDQGPSWRLVVSVGPDETLWYSALLGTREAHGKDLLADSVPVMVAQHLETLFWQEPRRRAS